MQLSERLKLVADFVTDGKVLADVGTDHGYIPIWLVENGMVPYAIAMDINRGPLDKAEEHIRSYGLSGKIETRLSDGVENLSPGEAQSIVIAGMGGSLTTKILRQGKEVLEAAEELILSPHTEIYLVREYLLNIGYDIVREAMVCDMGKYYTVIRAVKTSDAGIKEQYDKDRNNYIYGRLLIEERSEVFLDYMKKEEHKLENILNNISLNSGGSEKVKELEQRLAFVKKILNCA